ncbi:MAG: electron transport complex, RnfABCDGE type, subunit [Proteobacteria bacterium]|nr:electron transport complex, RnfABCDGE type, subunit [Pseudomonadota bacterium]
MKRYLQITRDGLWNQNVLLAQSIALCPAMAVTSSATNGLGMGLATTAVLATSNLLIALVRNWISAEVRIPVFVALIASLVTLVDMMMNAWLHDLYKVLGLFIALIVVNCAILGRAEAFASREPPLAALVDGISMGLGFTGALTLIGAIREVLGTGMLFQQAHLFFGQGAAWLEQTIIPNYGGMLLWILPPGGFLVMGMLLAGKRVLEQRTAERALRKANLRPIHCC